MCVRKKNGSSGYDDQTLGYKNSPIPLSTRIRLFEEKYPLLVLVRKLAREEPPLGPFYLIFDRRSNPMGLFVQTFLFQKLFFYYNAAVFVSVPRSLTIVCL